MALLIFTKREFLLKEEKLIFLKNYYTIPSLTVKK